MSTLRKECSKADPDYIHVQFSVPTLSQNKTNTLLNHKGVYANDARFQAFFAWNRHLSFKDEPLEEKLEIRRFFVKSCFTMWFMQKKVFD